MNFPPAQILLRMFRLRKIRNQIAASGLFDAAFYTGIYPEAAAAGRSALDHFVQAGLGLGHKPSAAFDPALYLALNPDVAASGEPPVLHFLRSGQREGRKMPNAQAALEHEIAASGLFDPDFYRSQYPDVAAAGFDPLAHYAEFGLKLGYWPSADFDPGFYLESNPDVAASGEAPLMHFIRNGRREGRAKPDRYARMRRDIEDSGLFDADFYHARYGDAAWEGQEPLDHYVETGMKFGHWPSADFDPKLYVELYPDSIASGEPPLLHFIRFGKAEGRMMPTRRVGMKHAVAASGLFDADFYLAHYADAVIDPREPLDHYIEIGMALGHWPSADFDPALYLAHNPDVVESGEPPLIHFIRDGRAEGRAMPNPRAILRPDIVQSGLFDADLYRELYPDVARAGVDPLDHYLEFGWREGRRPSLAFDGDHYLRLHPDVAKADINPLAHYVGSGKAEDRQLPRVLFDRKSLFAIRGRIAESGLFDLTAYLDDHPGLREGGMDPILHYLLLGFRYFHEPSPHFYMIAYLGDYPDVRGADTIPLLHYIDYGQKEGRKLRRTLKDAVWRPNIGLTSLPDLVIEFEMRLSVSFFSRYGFSFETSGPQHYASQCVAMLARRQPILAMEPLRPDVSIIIPVYGQLPFLLSCLDALSMQDSRFTVEIIVHDDVSPDKDQIPQIAAIPWIRYVRRQENGGFIDCCNSGAKLARGRYLVFLNSDTRVVKGWLDALIGTFELFPKAGFAGSKLFNADGTLQEAGGLYWSDGTAWNYGRGENPNRPKYCFARQVDYVSGAAIAVPRAIWHELGGFDVAYRPAYCEDADLAFRIRERGYEVWYQPQSRVIHYEGMTHGRDETSGVKAYQVANLKRLQETWRHKLKGKRPGGNEPDKEANRTATKKMLVIDAVTHKPDKDAGSFVAAQMMGAYRELGYQQGFLPFHTFSVEEPYTAAYQAQGVEAFYVPFMHSIEDVLLQRPDYDYVLIYRYGVASAVIDAIRTAIPTARIIFSNVDLHYLRTRREAEVSGDQAGAFLASHVQTAELDIFARVDCSLVHTPIERQIVEQDMPGPLGNIVEFPWIATIRRSAIGFVERRHVMFLGGFAHTPNVDAVEFFLDEVWPLIADALPAEAKFLIVGNAPPERLRALASERIVVTGYVEDLKPYFDEARVFVAPLRYGAGIKGKLIESLAQGVPSVATTIASEGIGLVDGRHCVIADQAEAIAAAVLRLYRDADIWSALQQTGYDFVEDNFSWKRALDLCRTSIEVADKTWLRRQEVIRKRHLRRALKDSGMMATAADSD